MRYIESSTRCGPGRRVAKATIRPSCSMMAAGKRLTYSGSKNPSEKPFSAPARCCSHSSETARNGSITGGTCSAGSTRNVACSRSRRCSACRYFLPPLAVEREPRQIHPRFLAQLDERQADVRVPVQVLPRYLVEYRHSSEIGAAFEKQLDQRADSLRRTHRAAERGSRAPLNRVHDET